MIYILYLTSRQANEILAKAGRPPIEDDADTKYKSKKIEVDGITFSSKKEADYYCELKLRKQTKGIKDFSLQPKFLLQEGYRDMQTGKKIRPIYYKSDFEIVHNDGSKEIVETKGFKTQVYKLKIKMFKLRYPDLKLTVL